MDLKFLRMHILGGSMARRVHFRAFMFALVMSIVPLVHILSNSGSGLMNPLSTRDCGLDFDMNWLRNRLLVPIWGSVEYKHCLESANLTVNVVRELMSMKLLSNHSVKALCMGEESASAAMALQDMGFSNVCKISWSPFFFLKHKKFGYKLNFHENSYDFVLFNNLDKVLVPATLIREIESALKPGGIAAVLVSSNGLPSYSLIKSATPVSSLLRASSVVHAGYIDEFTLVVFKKNIDSSGNFWKFQLPADCQAATNSKHLMEILEPLVDERPKEFEKRISYLPKYTDISTKKQLVYIDIGAGERLNPGDVNWFLSSYPIDQKAFHTYFVDHNTSVMLSYIKKPGVTFIYYPDLAGNKSTIDLDDIEEESDGYVEENSFDFLAWFKETVQCADFVVLKMNAAKVELEFLNDLVKSGAICYIDELFLGYPDKGDLLDLFKELRNNGVFVHQWWKD